MEYRVAIAPKANRDLRDIRDYIAKNSPRDAERFVLQLIETAMELQHTPRRGAEIKDTRGARFLVHRSYLIVYRVLDGSRKVRVLRFWHAARDIGRLRI